MATFWEPSGLRILSVVVLLAFLLLTLSCLAATSGSDDNTNPPPPPSPPRIPRMVEEFYVGQHQAREGDLDGFDLFDHQLDAMESSVRSRMKKNEEMRKALQEDDKDLHENMQIIQQMRRKLRKTQNDSEHARHDVSSRYGQEAAGQAYTMDEGTGPTHKLRFHGGLKPRIYTNKPLLKQSDEGIEIAIYRDGRIITSGDLSSVSVEIVALESNHTCKGSWTEEDFHRQIQMRRSGQGSVLEGDLSVKLVNGKASLGKIWFSEGSSGKHSREFVLAARIDMSEKIGVRVEEAFMHPALTVLVERSEANEKSVLPMLNDEVHRLKEISKGGVYADRLKQDCISTVQDFLKALNKDADNLREILKMKSKPKSWDVLVGHARECDLRDKHELKVKPYMVEGENVALFFNCIHDNVGAEFDGRYVGKDKFDPRQKAIVDGLKRQAYNELESIDFQYVMMAGTPAKISTNVNAAGSSSIPMSAVEKLGPSGIAPEPEPDLPLGGANCNAAGPSPPDHHYTHQSQGVAGNSIPEGDAIRLDTATTVWPIHTPYGPDLDPLMPTEDQSQIFWSNHRSV